MKRSSWARIKLSFSFLKMSFLSFSSKTFFELSQIYCLRIDFAFVWDFLYPAHFQRNFVQFSRYYRCRVTTFILYHVSWALTSYFSCPSSFSNDSFIILSSFCSLDKLFAWLPASAWCLPQTACITLQTFLLFVNIVFNKKIYSEY